MNRLGITEHNIGYFVMYLGGMGVVVRSLLLGRAVGLLGEARLSRLGLVLLAAGLACTGLASHGGLLFLGFTLMPLGTAFLFPCVTGLLSRVVPGHERGLYMGVQHTFGGASRVLFPVAAGILMDRFGVGVPFWLAGLLVLATLPFAWGLAAALPPEIAGHGRGADRGGRRRDGGIPGGESGGGGRATRRLGDPPGCHVSDFCDPLPREPRRHGGHGSSHGPAFRASVVLGGALWASPGQPRRRSALPQPIVPAAPPPPTRRTPNSPAAP